jgi:hypothetical protein
MSSLHEGSPLIEESLFIFIFFRSSTSRDRSPLAQRPGGAPRNTYAARLQRKLVACPPGRPARVRPDPPGVSLRVKSHTQSSTSGTSGTSRRKLLAGTDGKTSRMRSDSRAPQVRVNPPGRRTIGTVERCCDDRGPGDATDRRGGQAAPRYKPPNVERPLPRVSGSDSECSATPWEIAAHAIVLVCFARHNHEFAISVEPTVDLTTRA